MKNIEYNSKLHIKGSVLLYSGPSQIDGAPIIVVATSDSKNEKTGKLIQTWIMRSDIDPKTATKTGHDTSVCGNCAHKPTNYKAADVPECYVLSHKAPLSIYKAYHRGRYCTDVSQLPDADIRFGSYGDPVAAPIEVWTGVKHSLELMYNRKFKHTGYSHQWKEAYAQPYKGLLAASCDSVIDILAAYKLGWVPFAVSVDAIAYKAMQQIGLAACPASKERNYSKQCVDCMACSGSKSTKNDSRALARVDNRRGILIAAH